MSGTTVFYLGDMLSRQWQLGSGNFTPTDLTGAEVGWGMVSGSPSDPQVQLTSDDATPYITITDPEMGVVTLAYPTTAPSLLVPGVWSCALKVVYADGTPQTVYTETIRILPRLSIV